MSPPWTNLPYELVEKVFSEIDGRDILELQHICQAWRLAAQQRLFTDIRIPANGGRREQRLVQTLCMTSSKARHLVKSIVIFSFHLDCNLASLVAICSLCPNITSICIGGQLRQFYQALHLLRETQHLQKLQFITEPTADCIEDYSKLLLLLKNSVTEINVYHDPSKVIPESGSILNSFPLAKHLKGFSCLKKVEMTAPEYMALSQFDELLDMCSNHQINTVKLTLRLDNPGQQRRRLPTTPNQVIVKPQMTLPSVNELCLKNTTLLINQDMVYIMDKFPALQSLFIHLGAPDHLQNDEHDSYTRSIQSIGTVIAFIKYLWRIPYFEVDGFRTTLEMMCQVISQIAKWKQVNRIDLGAAIFDPQLVCLNVKRSRSSRGEIHLRIPQGMESVYQHVVSQQAFASRVDTLHLSGSGWRYYDSNRHTPAESKARADCLVHAINNYSSLKILSIARADISSTLVNAEFNRTLRLDYFSIAMCELDAESWDILSKQLEYVEQFVVVMKSWRYSDIPDEDVSMPHTAFGDINLDGCRSRFVNIRTSTNNTYIEFYEEDEPERLTEEQYHKIIADSLEVYIGCCLKVVCKEWASLTIEGITFYIIEIDDMCLMSIK